MKRNIVFALLLLSLSVFSQEKNDSKSPWKITATDTTNYVGIAMANGRIGLMPSAEPFKVKSVILNNVYGKESEHGVSKVLLGINFANLDITIDGELITNENISDWQQVLNMHEAAFTTSFLFKNKAKINYTIYALRHLPYMGLMDITVEALKDISVTFSGKIVCPADYKNVAGSYKILLDGEIEIPVFQTVAKSPFAGKKLAAAATFMFKEERPVLKHEKTSEYNHSLSFVKSIKKGSTYNVGWAGAICTSQDFEFPENEAARLAIFALLEPKNRIITQHRQAWELLWKSDIEIEGDLQSQRDVRLALYHLYSFSRDDSNLSIAPMGLSSQGYNGHIFWDTELWMYPPLLVLNQGIAKSLLNYRFERLGKAKQKARLFGYSGAMYPWESDDTGEEATPVWALTGTFEHHITADVGIAFWNYYRVTKDDNWLKSIGYPVLKEVADYWVSRSVKNNDGSYSINNVVGADEFAQNVDDNAFTNGSAIIALRYAQLASKQLGYNENPLWNEVGENIKLHYFDDGVTKEHRAYNGERIKQADVNLLSYPLGVITDEETMKKNLEYYESKMAEEGPAMSLSILSVLHARFGNTEKAFELFKRSYEPNKRPPFGALSESALSNNPYFATGAGGLLQAVLFGFGGLDITEDGIKQLSPALPAKWKSLKLKGIGVKKKNYFITH